MKQYSKKLLSLAVLCSTATSMVHADVLPFIQWRSEGRDTARKLYGQTAYGIYQQDEESWDGSFAATFQYDQSFRGRNIARCLFGDSLIGSINNAGTAQCNDECGDETLVIQGSQVTNKLARSWMAENFLLPRDFQSAIKFSPRVQNVLVDFDLYVGFSRWVNGMYFRLYGPVNWNKASLRAEETVIFPGTPTNSTVTPTIIGGGYTGGYFDPSTEIATQSLFTKAMQFFGGCELPAYADQSVTVQPLEFAKFSDCLIPGTNPCDSSCGNTSHRKTGFAELRGELGWNYFRERGRFLINIQAAAPTGSRPNAEYLFPAQIGNGKHWELGVGLGGAYKFWQSMDEEKCASFIWEADITHMFAAKQQRTFDLKGKPNSRYMLAQKVTNNSFVPTANRPNDSTLAFANEYAPVANFSTRDVKVSVGVQGDVVAMFNYTVRGFSWDIGYNFWGMSTSKIKIDNCGDECHGILPFPENTWALKGDASIAGYYFVGTAGDFEVVNLAATESAATIFNGTNDLITPPVTTPVTPSALTNPNIDTPVQAFVGTEDLSNGGNGGIINTSATPVLISINDLDIKGAEQRGLSNKIFTHFSYTWTKHERWLPFVGAGFSAQFGMHSGHGDDCDNDCSTPVTTEECGKSSSCALSNWAIFVKGGVSFH